MIEYLASNLWQVWAVVAVLGLILELSSGDFYIICFSVGAVGAAIASPFANFYVQIGVFCVLTAVCIVYVRPVSLRYLHKGEDNRVSNGDALIGQVGVVSESIGANGFGRVAVGGDDWKAVSRDSADLPVGTRVKVVGRESIIVTVERI